MNHQHKQISNQPSKPLNLNTQTNKSKHPNQTKPNSKLTKQLTTNIKQDLYTQTNHKILNSQSNNNKNTQQHTTHKYP